MSTWEQEVGELKIRVEHLGNSRAPVGEQCTAKALAKTRPACRPRTALDLAQRRRLGSSSD